MKLDQSQPWMTNHQIKNRILMANRMTNPVMEAYRQEYNSLALVPMNKEPREALRDPYSQNRE